MDTSEKLILLGSGCILGGIIIMLGLLLRIFPEYKIRRSQIISTAGLITGVALIIVGIVIKQAK